MIALWSMFVFGLFEVATNGYHLSKGAVHAIGASARWQHQELPVSASEVHYFRKVVVMGLFGVLFGGAAALVLFFHFLPQGPLVVATLFGVYGVVQALLYRREIKTWLAAVVYQLFLVLAFLGL